MVLEISRKMLYTFPQRAGVLELVDEVDSKSITSDGVRVRVPPPAPHFHPDFDRVGVGFFFYIFDELPIFPEFSE